MSNEKPRCSGESSSAWQAHMVPFFWRHIFPHQAVLSFLNMKSPVLVLQRIMCQVRWLCSWVDVPWG